MAKKNRVQVASCLPPGNPVIFSNSATALLIQLQPLPPAGFWAGASSEVELFSISVPPAPDFSPLHAVVAHPVTEKPAPAIKLAMLRLANSFFISFLSISTSTGTVNKKNAPLLASSKDV
jgi:hypothetical protein